MYLSYQYYDSRHCSNNKHFSSKQKKKKVSDPPREACPATHPERYSDLHRGKTFEAFFFHGLNFRGVYSPLSKTHGQWCNLTILAFGSPNNELLPALRQSNICIQMPAVTPKTFQMLGKCTVFNVVNVPNVSQKTRRILYYLKSYHSREGISSVSTLP